MPVDDTTCVYGVEEINEGKCLAEYDVVPDSTIRLAKGGSASADGKKWEVDAGGYFRGGGTSDIKVDYGASGIIYNNIIYTSDIKVDYGASGIAPPSSKVHTHRTRRAAHRSFSGWSCVV